MPSSFLPAIFLPLLLLLLSTSSLLPSAAAATQEAGRCMVVSPGYTQPFDSSSVCRAAAAWDAAHPDVPFSIGNPYNDMAYFGALGHVVGVTAGGAPACCQGRAEPQAGNCAQASNVLRCSAYVNGSLCVVEECEVPPVLDWVNERQQLITFITALLCAAGLLGCCVFCARAYRKRRVASARRATEELLLPEAVLPTISSAPYVQMMSS